MRVVRAERQVDEFGHVETDKHAELEGFGQFGLGVGDTFGERHRVDGLVDFAPAQELGYLVFVLHFGPFIDTLSGVVLQGIL